MSQQEILLYARNSHEVDRQHWHHFGNVLTQFYRHFHSHSQVMAEKPGGILRAGYRRKCNGLQDL